MHFNHRLLIASTALLGILSGCNEDSDNSNNCQSICKDDHTLLSCDSSGEASVEEACVNGCRDNACIENDTPQPAKCTESKCLDENTLAKCDAQTGQTTKTACPHGCRDNACIESDTPQPAKCTKTTCLDQKTLSQCNAQTGQTTAIECHNGCENDACRPDPIDDDQPKCTKSVCKDSSTLIMCDVASGATTTVTCKNGCENDDCKAESITEPEPDPDGPQISDLVEFVEQPTVVMPDSQGDISNSEFPDAKAILAMDRAGTSVYGLYAWAWEYQQNEQSIQDVGFEHIRFGSMSDDGMKLLANHAEQKAIYTHSVKKNDDESDDAYISRYTAGLLEFLGQYGPKGSYFSKNPSVPYQPITAVEIENEPNFQYMLPNGTEAQREALYARVLPAAYDAVKAKYPDVTVIGFGAGGASAGDIRFVQHVLDINPDVIHKMDVFSTHPYVLSSPFCYTLRSWGKYSVASSLKSLRALFDKAGRPEMPIYYTEMGWEISKADGGKYDRPANSVTTPVIQAAHIVQTYALALRLGVRTADIMFTVDTDGYNGGFFSNNTYRPSAYAVKTMKTLLPDPRLVSIRSDGESGVFSYDIESRKDGKILTMMFAPKGAQSVEFKTSSARISVTDMLGHTNTYAVSNGSVKLEAGPCPLYIDEAPSSQAVTPCDCKTGNSCSEEQLKACQSPEMPSECDCKTGNKCSDEQKQACWYQAMVDESIYSTGNNYRLKKVIEKARAGKDIYIAAIGGSVTAGGYVSEEERYPSRVADAFATLFAKDKSKVHLVNAGISDTTSVYGVMRFDKDVIGALGHAPDILILEYMANNLQTDSFWNSYEGIIRHTLKQDNNPVVINLIVASSSHYTAWIAKKYIPLEEHYQLPVIDMTTPVEKRIDDGSLTLDKYFKNASDVVHPSAYGFQVMGDAVKLFFQKIDGETIAAQPYSLPEKPYYTDGYDQIAILDASNPAFSFTPGSFNQTDKLYASKIPSHVMHGKSGENDPLKFSLQCRTLLIAYTTNQSMDYGDAEVYVDGKKLLTLNGHLENGSYDGKVLTEPLVQADAIASHTVEIKMANGNANKQFTILGFGYE